MRAATRLPIATGERAHTIAEIRRVIETGLADIMQTDLTHFGGFLADEARWPAGPTPTHLLMAPHNVCGPVGTMANVHFAVATPNYKVLEHFNDFADPWVQELVDHAPTVDARTAASGCRSGPASASGSNADACAEHPRTGGRMRLFEEGWEQRGTEHV